MVPCHTPVVGGCHTPSTHGEEQVTPQLGVGGCAKGSTLSPHMNSSTSWHTAGCWPRLSLLHVWCVLGLTPTLTGQTSVTPRQAVGSGTPTHGPRPTFPQGSRMGAGGVRYPHKAAGRVLGCLTHKHQSPVGLQHVCSLTHAYTRVQEVFKSICHSRGAAVCVLGVLVTLTEGCFRSTCHKHTKTWFAFRGCPSLTRWAAGCVSGCLAHLRPQVVLWGVSHTRGLR